MSDEHPQSPHPGSAGYPQSKITPQQAADTRARQATEIVHRLRAVAPEVLGRYPVDAAYVYGSVARGTPLPDSDVDIALLWDTPPAPYQRLLTELEIQAALEDASGLARLDVHSLNDAPLNVRGAILAESILLYCVDHDHRVAFEVNTRKRYFDFQPLAARLRQRILARIREKGLHYGQTRNC
jgi:predicted nucleotidyltransferase